METETTKKEGTTEMTGNTAPISAGPAVGAGSAAPAAAPHGRGRGTFGGRAPFQKNPRKAPRREPRAKPEFDQKIISIRRVTRVVTGGRRFSFSVAIVAGNRKGQVGVGLGKAGDTSLAIEKALRSAKKNMITVRTTNDMSIPHDVRAKYCGSDVVIMPAPGRGLIAGSSVRPVLELAGIKNCGAKILSRSKNKINNARAAIFALGQLKNMKPRQTASVSVEK